MSDEAAIRYAETDAYAEAILFPDYKDKYDLNNRPPVWAESRPDLMDSLEYFATIRGGAYRSNGVIHGFLLDADCGERAYMDSEIVVCRLGGPAGANNRTARKRWTDPRNQDGADVLVQAFRQTRQIGLSVVLIMGNRCPVSPVGVDERFSVMDHFRVTAIWPEKTSRGKTFYQVRFERVIQNNIPWWSPTNPQPPLNRDPRVGALIPESLCMFCNAPSPQVYAEAWFCTNHECAFFFCGPDGETLPKDLTFDRAWLKQRLLAPQWFQPAYDLAPDLMSSLTILGQTNQISAALRALWRGIVCTQCGKCVPRIEWHIWTCNNCDIDYGPNPGSIDLRSVVSRPSVSYMGHPPITPAWPEYDFGYQGPVFRQHYRLERWLLHDNSTITLLSPTASFNEGDYVEYFTPPDTLWDDMLDAANDGRLGLRRAILDPKFVKRSPYFFNHFGADYDFSGESSTPFYEAPPCVTQSMDLVRHVGLEEMKHLYELPNQVSVNGYMSGMDIAWHTDGEEEVGSTISTLSLGGDAVMRVRLQSKYYNNDIDLKTEEPIVGALDWRNLTKLKRRWEAGEITDEELHADPEAARQWKGKYKPHIEIPLIHGSIVIMTGTALTKYYEHSVEVKDSIRFAVTCRTIDEAKRTQYLTRTRYYNDQRLGGQFFTAQMKRAPGAKPTDDAGADDDDYNDDDDDDDLDENHPDADGTLPHSAAATRKKPRRKPPAVRKAVPRPSRRTAAAASTSASASASASAPPSTEASPSRSSSPATPARSRRTRGLTPGREPGRESLWSAEEDVKLAELHGRLGNRWTAISKEFPDRGPAACRLRVMTVTTPGGRVKRADDKRVRSRRQQVQAEGEEEGKQDNDGEEEDDDDGDGGDNGEGHVAPGYAPWGAVKEKEKEKGARQSPRKRAKMKKSG